MLSLRTATDALSHPGKPLSPHTADLLSLLYLASDTECVQAVSEGRWLLIEDINLAPPDVLASLVGLLERRQLYLPQRAQSIAAHPGFQLIASVTSSPGAPC